MGHTKARLQALWRRDLKRRLTAGGLDVAASMARAGLLAKARGRGAIFTLHHVRPKQIRPLQPSAHLEITPDFLAEAIERLMAEGYEFLPLTAVGERLAGANRRPFAVFTLDDGYRNNVDHALPVFERYGVPFTVFVSRGFAERSHSLWWETLAELLGTRCDIAFDFGAGMETVALTSESAKFDAFERFAHFVHDTDEAIAVARIDALARKHGVDPLDITAELTLPPEALRDLSRHRLADLGAHTISHRALSRLAPQDAADEMRQSADYVEALTGKRPSTIAYPYGTRRSIGTRDYGLAREAGFSLAVTTQPGTLDEACARTLTGLPRISLNGFHQDARYVSALASGIPFSLMRR